MNVKQQSLFDEEQMECLSISSDVLRIDNNLYRDLSLSELQAKCNKCTRCGLHYTRKNVVFDSGNALRVPPAMMIGEGPGEWEDKKGKPFVGRAGRMLDEVLGLSGINRNVDLYITNIIKCRPPGNRDPSKKETQACIDYLKRQIQMLKPRVIIAMGKPASEVVLDRKVQITKTRGRWYTARVSYMEHTLHIMPVLHTAYLLRNKSEEPDGPKWLTVNDFSEVRKKLEEIRDEIG